MPTLRYLGHACFEARDGSTSIVIDPFLTGNPLAAVSADELSPTAIIVTHGHNDHVGDALGIAKRCGATIVGNYEVATFLGQKGASNHGMHIGGAHQFPWGWVKLTQAWHGSTYADADGMHALGVPAGALLRLGDRLLYHAGDTALFSDMSLIGRHGIEVALLPIGDNFTMGPEDALEAVKFLQPKLVVPMHYNTFDLIRQDPQSFARQVETETAARCVVLGPGESLDY